MADPIKLVPSPKADINEGCINILREALQRAKNGEVHGVAICLAVVDPGTPSGQGTIHLTTYDAKFRASLFCGVGAMDFSMKAEMHTGVLPVDRLKEDDLDE